MNHTAAAVRSTGGLAVACRDAVAPFDAVTGDYEMRAVGTVPEQPPVFGILAAPRVAGEALQRISTVEHDSEAAVPIALYVADHGQRRAMLLEPLALRDVEDRIGLVPIELLRRGGLIGGTVEVIAPEEDGTAIDEPPAALDVESQIADFHDLTFAVPRLTPWAELEHLHVGGAPTIADWLPNQHAELGRDSVGEWFHGDS